MVSGIVDLRDVKDTDHDASGNCTIIDQAEERVLFTGTIAGNVVSGTLVAYDISLPLIADVSGDTITGSARDNARSLTFSITRVASQPVPMVVEFTADPVTVRAGQSATLRWTVFNAVSLSIDHGVGSKPVSGTATVTPASTTTYTLTAVGSSGSTVTSQTTVTVASVDRPMIVTFTATPHSILVGQCSTLAWTTANATSVSIDNGVGGKPVNGSTAVCPSRTTMYKLTAIGEGGSAARSLPVTVHARGRTRAVRR